MKANRQFILLIVLLAAGLALWLLRGAAPDQNALRAREIATRVLAEHLVKSQAGQRVLIFSNPFTQKPGTAKEIRATEEAGLRGLKEAFAGHLEIEAVVFPDLKPAARDNPRGIFIDAETTTPLSFLVAEDAFDKVISQHPTCDLAVSLIGLPAELDRVHCWQTNALPKFALLLPDLRIIGDTDAVRHSVKRGKLAAFVLPKPGAPNSSAPVGSDVAKEFDRRFLLVTADNIDKLIDDYPNLFPR